MKFIYCWKYNVSTEVTQDWIACQVLTHVQCGKTKQRKSYGLLFRLKSESAMPRNNYSTLLE